MFKPKKLKARKTLHFPHKTEKYYWYDDLPCLSVQFEDSLMFMIEDGQLDMETIKGILSAVGFSKNRPINVTRRVDKGVKAVQYWQDREQ